MDDLDGLMARAAKAPANSRIEFRDAIAEHGPSAVPGLGAWLGDPRLGRFAARTLERIARNHREPALAALRAGLDTAPTSVDAEIRAAIERLDPSPPPRAPRTPRPREPRTWPDRRLGHPYGEIGAYRILNTNHHNDASDDSYMVSERRAAAFFGRWKRHIEAIQPGDLVFLYRTGTGIVAMGQAAGPLRKRAYHGKPENADEEFYRNLDPFQRVEPPVSAGEIKGVTKHAYPMRGTLFSLPPELGDLLLTHLTGGPWLSLVVSRDSETAARAATSPQASVD